MGNHGSHERPATVREKALDHALRVVTRLVSAEVLIGFLHLLVTTAAVYGLIGVKGGGGH